MFVQSVDNLYYCNPVVGTEDWVLDFNEDIIEIAVKKFKKTSVASARLRASRYLREAGIIFKFGTGITVGSHLFHGHLAPGFRFVVRILEPIPIPTSFEYATSYPTEGIVLSWYYMFEKEDILRVFTGRDPKKFLFQYLLNRPYFTKNEIESNRELVKKILLKQFPYLKIGAATDSGLPDLFQVRKVI